jgi:hypothetical protein
MKKNLRVDTAPFRLVFFQDFNVTVWKHPMDGMDQLTKTEELLDFRDPVDLTELPLLPQVPSAV